MRISRDLSLAAASLLCLAACGGSGGSASSTSTLVEPAVPKASYNGVTTQATLDTEDAYDFQQVLFTAIQFLEDNVPRHRFAIQTYDETIAGSAGGTAVLSGIIKADGSGWVEEQLNDYATTDEPGVLENGTVIIYQDSTDETHTLGFDGYTATVDGFTYKYNGSIINTGVQATGTVSISSGPDSIELSGLKILGSPGNPEKATGRIYNSRLGYVSIATLEPTYFGGAYVTNDFPSVYPQRSGEVKLDGAGGTSLDIQILNGYLLYLGLDSDGDGKIDLGARLDITTGELDAVQPTGSTVSPLIEVPNVVAAKGPVTLDGRYSYTPGGFVSYSWSLLAAPFGSVAKLSGDQPIAQFKPDVPGDYEVELTVSSDGKSASDVLPVTFTGQAPPLGAVPPTQLKVAPYVRGHVGESVTLDARASPDFVRIGESSSNLWTLSTPFGSHAKIADPTAVTTSFTPDVPGIYYAVLAQGTTETSVPVSSVSVITADVDLRFAQPALVVSDVYGDSTTAHFGASVDSIAYLALGGSAPPQIRWWTLGSTGLFTQGGALTTEDGEFPGLLATDLNGDGKDDFVTATTNFVTNCPMDFHESGSGGYTLTTATYAPGCGVDSVAPLRTATLGGHPAVFELESDSDVVAIPTDGAGNPGTPVITAAGLDELIDFGLADMDGDGKTDLLAMTDTKLSVYLGDDTGNFTLKGSVSLAGTPVSLATGDFNGDGKQDVAVLSGNTLYLYYGDGSGGLSAPDKRALTCASGLNFLQAVDLNNDGHPDLVFGSCGAGVVPFGALGILLSQKTGGQWSISNESLYPTPAYGARSITAGDFLGDGLQGLVLNNGTDLLFMPQLPSVTSGTIDSHAPTALAQPQHDQTWHKGLPKTKVPMLRPDAAPH